MTPASPLMALPGVSAHARERMVTHFGMDPGDMAWLSAVLAIYERRALLLAIQGHGVEIYALAVGSASVKAVYKPAGAVIVTVLPFDACLSEASRDHVLAARVMSRAELGRINRRNVRTGRAPAL